MKRITHDILYNGSNVMKIANCALKTV